MCFFSARDFLGINWKKKTNFAPLFQVIKLKNNHRHQVRVTVREHIPQSMNDKVKASLRLVLTSCLLS